MERFAHIEPETVKWPAIKQKKLQLQALNHVIRAGQYRLIYDS